MGLRAAVIACVLVLASAAVAVAAPPAATDDSLTVTRKDGATTATGSLNVLANDSDPDGDTLTVTGYTQPANGGEVECTPGGRCTYTDPGGPPGTDSFTYTVSDGNETDTGTVSVKFRNSTGGGGGGGATAHERSVTMRLRRHLKATGSITSDAAVCERSQAVKIQRRVAAPGRHNGFATIKKTRTEQDGTYSVAIPDLIARYRAHVDVTERCKSDSSAIRNYWTARPHRVADANDTSGQLDIKSVIFDRDDKNLYWTIATHEKWSASFLSGGRRVEGFIKLASGYWWVWADKGEQKKWLITAVQRCSGSIGSGAHCGEPRFGSGYKVDGKRVRFWAPRSMLDGAGKRPRWRSGTASSPGGLFDYAPADFVRYRPGG